MVYEYFFWKGLIQWRFKNRYCLFSVEQVLNNNWNILNTNIFLLKTLHLSTVAPVSSRTLSERLTTPASLCSTATRTQWHQWSLLVLPFHGLLLQEAPRKGITPLCIYDSCLSLHPPTRRNRIKPCSSKQPTLLFDLVMVWRPFLCSAAFMTHL